MRLCHLACVAALLLGCEGGPSDAGKTLDTSAPTPEDDGDSPSPRETGEVQESSPGPPEVCDDADLDEDGDGLSDDADPSVDPASLLSWYVDADADGYGDPESVLLACDAPEGTVTNAEDCDDTRADVYPGAPVDWTEGEITDCELPAWPEDCAAEGSLAGGDAEAVLGGQFCDGLAGYSLTGEADVNGDGMGDIAVGAWQLGLGTAYVVLSPLKASRSLATSEAKLLGPSGYQAVGTVVASAGETDGDGYDDLLLRGRREVGKDRQGAAWLVRGPVEGVLNLGDADARVDGELGQSAWLSPAGAGDVDGDGTEDLAFALPSHDYGADFAGEVYLVSGHTTGATSVDAADAVLTGESWGDRAGTSVASAGDTDGDGVSDLLVGAQGRAHSQGAVYVVLGPIGGSSSLADADGRLTGGTDSDLLGWSLARGGDVNGDGYMDIAVGEGGTGYAGAAWIALGPLGSKIMTTEAEAQIVGEATSDMATDGLSSAGDVDDDGCADLLIGAKYNDEADVDAGAAYLQLGPLSGVLSLADADQKFLGVAAEDSLGWQVSAAARAGKDGQTALLLGAPYQAAGYPWAGAVHLYTPEL